MNISQQQQDFFQITTRQNRRGRRSTGSTTLDISCLTPVSLLRTAVYHQLGHWRLEYASNTDVSSLRTALPLLSERSTRLLDTELGQLTSEGVHEILRSLDNDFASPSIKSDIVAARLYSNIHKLLRGVPGRLKDGLTFSQAAKSFVLNNRRWRRKPQLPLNDLPSALGQIPHIDLRDLRRKAELDLQYRKKSIEQLALKEIENYETIFSLHHSLIANQPQELLCEELTTWITCDRGDNGRLPSCTPHQFAAVILKLVQDKPPPLDSNGFPLRLRIPRSRLDWSLLPQIDAYRWRISVWPWFFAQQRLPNAVLTAIFILLLSHTGWNPSSVGSLTIDGIIATPQGGYKLQGYKSKTDDHTPTSEVPRYQSAVCKAIDLLLWNYRQLVNLRLLDPEQETRVWFGWQDNNFKTTVDVISRTRIASICERHNIEYFTPSELRPIRAALEYLPQRDIEAVRVLLGHTDLITSDTYLENTLFFRLNEAMMLEFQRRIETTLTYATGGEAMLIQRSLDTRHIDRTLFLVPTGDGGVCANSFDGPLYTRAEKDEPCAGLACHSDGGCKHYHLIVNATTLEIAMRTRLYYRTRWQRLYETNPATFTEMHLPKLMYTCVLLMIVKAQRPDLYTQAERALT